MYSFFFFALALSVVHDKIIHQSPDSINQTSLFETFLMMCRSTSDLSLIVWIHVFPNYRITMTVHIVGKWWTSYRDKVEFNQASWSMKGEHENLMMTKFSNTNLSEENIRYFRFLPPHYPFFTIHTYVFPHLIHFPLLRYPLPPLHLLCVRPLPALHLSLAPHHHPFLYPP
jgi:hypothetical protein